MKNGITLKLDTGKEGIEAVFKPYQYEIIKILREHGEQGSRSVYTELKDRGLEKSRATVIFFLNSLVNYELAEFWEKSGKGGYGRIYKITLSEKEFDENIVQIFMLKLCEAFPQFEWLKTVWDEEK